MYPPPIQKLIDYFAKLPGIGPRAAGRFVFSLLKEDPSFLKEFGKAIANLPRAVGQCRQCFRSVGTSNTAPENLICSLCSNKNRTPHTIMALEKESDLLMVEKSGSFQGLYHVLGGTVSPLDPESPKKLKIKELYERVAAQKKENKKLEVILATNPTPEGDMTANYIERVLEPLAVTVTRLGRGITAGSELEYLDESTIRNSLINRK